MDFGLSLYDAKAEIINHPFDVTEDAGIWRVYDLLAFLKPVWASFLLIAQGQVPQKALVCIRDPLTDQPGGEYQFNLLEAARWFEYLMPN